MKGLIIAAVAGIAGIAGVVGLSSAASPRKCGSALSRNAASAGGALAECARG